MGSKLIVVAHGIGDTKEGFEHEWRAAMENNIDLGDAEVKGLWWEDVLKEIEDRYPLLSENMGDLLSLCAFPKLKELLENESYQTIMDFMMDVLVYVGLDDMWLKIQNQCAMKLDALRKDDQGNEIYKESDTILVGHSLGAAMLPHLVWREYALSGVIPYHGLILLASPLAFESPLPGLCQDFLQRMADLYGDTREATLTDFAGAWDMVGDGRLRFIINDNDIVCADVAYTIPGSGKTVDLIPLRQGFNAEERAILNTEHPGSVDVISFGEPTPYHVVANHDALTYLQHPAFIKALEGLL